MVKIARNALSALALTMTLFSGPALAANGLAQTLPGAGEINSGEIKGLDSMLQDLIVPLAVSADQDLLPQGATLSLSDWQGDLKLAMDQKRLGHRLDKLVDSDRETLKRNLLLTGLNEKGLDGLPLDRLLITPEQRLGLGM
jgi:hypothetical protein